MTGGPRGPLEPAQNPESSKGASHFDWFGFVRGFDGSYCVASHQRQQGAGIQGTASFRSLSSCPTDPAALLLARRQHSRGAPLTLNSNDESKREQRIQDGARFSLLCSEAFERSFRCGRSVAGLPVDKFSQENVNFCRALYLKCTGDAEVSPARQRARTSPPPPVDYLILAAAYELIRCANACLANLAR